jgi:hypothetical protein
MTWRVVIITAAQGPGGSAKPECSGTRCSIGDPARGGSKKKGGTRPPTPSNEGAEGSALRETNL